MGMIQAVIALSALRTRNNFSSFSIALRSYNWTPLNLLAGIVGSCFQVRKWDILCDR